MTGDDRSAVYETLFGRQARLDLPADMVGPEKLVREELKVAIAGTEIDFGEPAAVRLAAGRIFGLAGREERRAALDQVPFAFRATVKILVERAFYNRYRTERK